MGVMTMASLQPSPSDRKTPPLRRLSLLYRFTLFNGDMRID
jgi:hypothetical protein